jgi:hypothetical protein
MEEQESSVRMDIAKIELQRIVTLQMARNT